MSAELPVVAFEDFAGQLAELSPQPISQLTARICHQHYGQLRQWNRRLSLVGAGTAQSVIERHYGESLAGLSGLRPTDRTLIDIGTGAGFPGFVIAAACPGLEVFLIESRYRKWSFLQAVSRRARAQCEAADDEARLWSCTALAARIGPHLPAGLPASIDVVTSRAVNLHEGDILRPLAEHSPSVRFLLWQGATAPELERFETVAEHRIHTSTHGRIATVIPSAIPSNATENGSIES